jgi:hypothetical protein
MTVVQVVDAAPVARQGRSKEDRLPSSYPVRTSHQPSWP